MKILVISVIFLLILSCSEKPTASNPYDLNYDLPEVSNLVLEQLSGSIRISWDYELENIEGFSIKRRVGTVWQDDFALAPADAREWIDDDVPGGEYIQYRIAAFAGDNFADFVPSETVGN
ncbi:MAG: hypothetical protein K9N06_08435 [Candidatus Cloacimonetes bacterium]|nr:hypothetical protein [Candidatus Cloacimonadota bacterium]